jgi:hypothetical protein
MGSGLVGQPLELELTGKTEALTENPPHSDFEKLSVYEELGSSQSRNEFCLPEYVTV